jgi:hypothetical protein
MTSISNAKRLSRDFAGAFLTVLIVFFSPVGSASAAELHALGASVVSFSRPVRAKVQALGLGATVKVSTVAGHKHYHGYITRIDEDSFEVTDRATLSPNTFQYWTVNHVTGRRLPEPANRTRPGVTPLFHAISKLGFGP